MVERLDVVDLNEDPEYQVNSRASLGLDGIQIELQDFNDVAYPKPKDTVAESEKETAIIFGKIGNTEVARKLNAPQQR